MNFYGPGTRFHKKWRAPWPVKTNVDPPVPGRNFRFYAIFFTPKFHQSIKNADGQPTNTLPFRASVLRIFTKKWKAHFSDQMSICLKIWSALKFEN
jgi:hypothetical protein